MNLTTLIQSILLVAIGAVGTILFKMGVDQTQGIIFSDPVTIVNFVLSPYILVSLVLFMLGRILLSIPLESTDVGKYMFILTPLTLVAILALSNLLLNEPINMKQTFGIGLIIAGVYLLGI